MKNTLTQSKQCLSNPRCLWAGEINSNEVSEQRYNLLETFTFDSNLKQDSNEGKVVIKLEVYTSTIEDTPETRLYKISVSPNLAQVEREEIAHIVNKLVDSLKENSPP